MYRIPKAVKTDPMRRWALPDRVFFAAGARHILAYACIERCAPPPFKAVWIKPAKGFTGNHIVALRGETAFDYHGFSNWLTLLDHMTRKADRWWPGWSCDLVELPLEVLISEQKSRQFHEDLWLRGPTQFLHDALPRAHRFLDRFPKP